MRLRANRRAHAPTAGRAEPPAPARPPTRLLGFAALTFTGRHRVAYAPPPVGLAPDDPLARVVVPRVADEHQLGVVVVLDLVGQPPPAVLHRNAVDIGTGDS